MHSVLVFGDVRTHGFTRDPSEDKQRVQVAPVYGGAIMLADAIKQALVELPQHPTEQTRPVCYTFERPTEGSTGFEWRDWQLVPTKLEAPHDSERLRLRFAAKKSIEGETNTNRYPALSRDFIRALKPLSRKLKAMAPKRHDEMPTPIPPVPPGCFDPVGKRLFWCPDIVVLDDLSGDLRKVRFNAVPSISSLTPTEDKRENFENAIGHVMQRLLMAADELQNNPNDVPLEPLIICCLSGPLPMIDDDDSQEKSFWECLYYHQELRARTVVVLDVNDLRDEEHLAISSGVSWERTAQDAIAELNRSPQLRTLLEFSQLIIRFGVTGALHITRQGEKAWAYQLFFDPTRDDRACTEADTSGTVLGYAAVMAATIVQHVTKACYYRGESPVLHDVFDAIADAIPIAIARSQKLVQNGYGGPDDYESMSSSFPDGLFSNDPLECMISSITVPPLRSRSWSIASHASQGRTGVVARNIVRVGMRLALNQAVPTQREFVEDWTRRLSARIWQSDSIGTDWDEFNISDALVDDFERVVDQLVYLPIRESEEYATSVFAGAEGCGLLEALKKHLKDQVLRAKDLASEKRFVDLADYADHLSIIARDLRKELQPTLSRMLRLPSRLDPRFNPVVAPVVQFGKDFVLVDRREIEGIRAVQKLIKDHLDNIRDERDPNKHKPLSIAVFGPPGSGKSTAVKQIVKLFEEHPTKTHLMKDAYNLAQFTRSDDLDQAFDAIVNAGAEHKVPIAFFDEFDARFENEEWGWLKFFLSPMEDGRYRGKPVHTAIFVFAGGTSPTYAQFCLENRASTDPQVQAFGRAKGPDFVSRLRGFLNVVGINPADPDDDLYLIRRAIIVRTTLSRIQELSEDEEARIDPEILRAILFVPHYVNGARSIRTLLEICSRSERKRVTNSALPLIHQLNMLTDGKAFLDLLTNVSADIHE